MNAYESPGRSCAILHTARTIAIVGLSSNVLRPSNFVGFYLQRHGYRVVPVNPRETEVLGERSYASLADIAGAGRRGRRLPRARQFVPGIADEAVAVGAHALWLQFGVISGEGARIADRGGLEVVMDRCMKVEHARHMGRMHWLGFNTGRVTARRARSARRPCGSHAPSRISSRPRSSFASRHARISVGVIRRYTYSSGSARGSKPLCSACASAVASSAPSDTLPSTSTTSRVRPTPTRATPARIRFVAVGDARGVASTSAPPSQ